MTEQYTPTTDEVREEFIYGHQELDMDGNVVVSFDEAQARWDRWLAKRDAEVAAKAYERAILDVGLNPDLANQLLDTNPYRKAVQNPSKSA